MGNSVVPTDVAGASPLARGIANKLFPLTPSLSYQILRPGYLHAYSMVRVSTMHIFIDPRVRFKYSGRFSLYFEEVTTAEH